MQSLESVLERIERAAQRSHRRAQDITLLPISKGQSAERIKDRLSDKRFPRRLGESYLQEFVAKKNALPEILEWHFVGPLQSKKILEIANHSYMIHTIYRTKELDILKQAKQVPHFLIQVNVSEEPQKAGCHSRELKLLLEHCEKINLMNHCRGLMCLPAPLHQIGELKLRQQFGHLRKLRDELLPGGILSMGMSEDFEIAIEEGSQIIRLGTLLFGERE